MAKAKEEVVLTKFAKAVEEHIQASYQILHVVTSEFERATAELRLLGKKMNAQVIRWDAAHGFASNTIQDDKTQQLANNPAYASNPVLALNAIRGNTKENKDTPFPCLGERPQPLIFVFENLDDLATNSPPVRAALIHLHQRQLLCNVKWKRPIIILSSPGTPVHPKLRHYLTPIEFELPDDGELRKIVESLSKGVTGRDGVLLAPPTPPVIDAMVTNLRGLTHTEAENCMARAIVSCNGYGDDVISIIKMEKAASVRRGGVLTYIPDDDGADAKQLGGFGKFMSWLNMRKPAYTREAQDLGIAKPRGVVLLGVPGTGKTMMARAICKELKMPGYILDPGKLFGGLVGESEFRTREILNTIDAQRGCVLLIDEADKSFRNAHGSAGDSGVTARVFGTILSWLSDSDGDTFVVITLNRTDGIPPEMFRAGRFDAVFYTDLPLAEDRRRILQIHLQRNRVDVSQLGLDESDWKMLEDATADFVGSEIEQVVKNAQYAAFMTRKVNVPTFDELYGEAKKIRPLSQLDSETITAIREFCKTRAIPVADTPEPITAGPQQRSVTLGNK